MVFITLALALRANAIDLPLTPLMLEERAYVEDIRAVIQPPNAVDYDVPPEKKPFDRRRTHALERAIEDSILNTFIHFGEFSRDQPLPPRSRIMIRVDVSHAEIEPWHKLAEFEYTRVVNGWLRVVFLPGGEEIGGIPVRFLATVETLSGALYGFKSVMMIDVAGRATTNYPHDGRWKLLHLRNEHLLLDALHAQSADCAKKLL